MGDLGNGPSRWGIAKDYARLNDVLLGRPENYRWVEAGPIIQRTLQNAEKTGAKFDLQVAMAQNEEMGWEALVVPIPSHFVHMDGIVVPLAPKLAVACLDAFEDWVIDWMRAKGFDFVDVGYKEAKSLGVNLVSTSVPLSHARPPFVDVKADAL